MGLRIICFIRGRNPANHSMERTRDLGGIAQGWCNIGDEGGLLSSNRYAACMTLLTNEAEGM